MAVFAISLRFVAPTLLLGPTLLSLAAVAGFLLAAGVGWYRGSVLVAILVATLPVFAFDAASTALFEPATLELAVRAARRAAWFSIGVSVLVAGPLGYAIGSSLRSDDESLRPLRSLRSLHIADEQYGPLLVWGCVAAVAVVVCTVSPVSVISFSVTLSPILVVGGVLVATFLGYRSPDALASALAAEFGVSSGLWVFTQGFAALDAGVGVTSSVALLRIVLFGGVVLLAGFVAGIPLGLAGYVIGRTLDA
ncbi:hypothetical protein [Haladaptatus sp.]|uniref:hypothetical protein n=1 Tax=Haladaptatus sp. TaxID=1973141 RepID=UPI003C4BC86E